MNKTTIIFCLLILVCSFSLSADEIKQTNSITNSIGMKLIHVPAGSFDRGNPEQLIGRLRDPETRKEYKVREITYDLPQHRVKITKGFYLGQTEVTQEQWKKVMGTMPWKTKSYVPTGDEIPAVCISWHDALEFCNKLSEANGRTYRLPTEAEWEYACRASTTSTYHFGSNSEEMSKFGWADRISLPGTQSGKYPKKVGLKKSNPWGFFDMYGNVSEWCLDNYNAKEYEQYKEVTAVDPIGPRDGFVKVTRGGSWTTMEYRCTSYTRDRTSARLKLPYLGFRVLLEEK